MSLSTQEPQPGVWHTAKSESNSGRNTTSFGVFNNNNNNQCISLKMVSQLHTITNISLLTDGPVIGLAGYNPFFTFTVYCR